MPRGRAVSWVSWVEPTVNSSDIVPLATWIWPNDTFKTICQKICLHLGGCRWGNVRQCSFHHCSPAKQILLKPDWDLTEAPPKNMSKLTGLCEIPRMTVITSEMMKDGNNIIFTALPNTLTKPEGFTASMYALFSRFTLESCWNQFLLGKPSLRKWLHGSLWGEEVSYASYIFISYASNINSGWHSDEAEGWFLLWKSVHENHPFLWRLFFGRRIVGNLNTEFLNI